MSIPNASNWSLENCQFLLAIAGALVIIILFAVARKTWSELKRLQEEVGRLSVEVQDLQIAETTRFNNEIKRTKNDDDFDDVIIWREATSGAKLRRPLTSPELKRQ
jgi:predicted nucleic acid-binding protein